MEIVTLYPSRLHGSALVPSSKSEAHRALLLAALGRGVCCLQGFAPPLCDDTKAMISGIAALGAKVAYEGETIRVTAASNVLDVPSAVCNVGACAAALRMLIPVFLVRGQAAGFVMTDELFARTLEAYEPLLTRIGGEIRRVPSTEASPARVELSGCMLAGDYEIDGSQSSQFVSGMLIALANAVDAHGVPAASTLTVRGASSRAYIDMTLMWMRRFGYRISETAKDVFSIEPTGTALDEAYVPGDWTQAAVLLCINAMGGSIIIENLSGAPTNSLQGDARILKILSRMGLRTLRTHEALYAVSPSRAALLPIDVDCSDMPDIVPILALTCTQACGKSTLTGVRRLRLKECDRLRATVELLGQLGARVELGADDDTLSIYGRTTLMGGFEADVRNDHRVAMLLAAAALICAKPITLRGAEALNKSWPGFLDTWRSLGGKTS